MKTKLIESSVNPEDLMHASYRKHIVEYLVGLVYAHESAVIIAEKGYGLSRLLRFITYGNYLSKPIKTKLIYLNLLDFTAKGLDGLIIELEDCSERIEKGAPICFLIDEVRIDEKTQDLFKLINGYRSRDKKRFSYIIGLTLTTLDQLNIKTPPSYMVDLIGNNIFRLPPLSQLDFFKVAEEMITRFGLSMTREQIGDLYETTKGVPLQLRLILQNKFKERFLGEVEEDSFGGYDLVVDDGHILCKNKRIDLELTRAEERFLRLIIEKRGEIVTRDTLGALLSPESDGQGVSNESIDQVIYRLRKKLIKFECLEKVETYVGRGYGLSAPVPIN